MLTRNQLDSIENWAARGAETGTQALRACHATDSELEIREIHCATLGEMPEVMPCFDGECVAGVAGRYRGGDCGASLLAMNPEDALSWVQSDQGVENPLESFVKLGGLVQTHLIEAIGSGLGLTIEADGADLREDSVPLILYGTHAPSDTVIVCIGVHAAVGDRVVPMRVYLMIEPKLLHTALAA
jgi:hypothetical protein